jgi:hypothetical protein
MRGHHAGHYVARVALQYKCLFKNNFTYIATFQDVLDCGSIPFILDLEAGRLPV